MRNLIKRIFNLAEPDKCRHKFGEIKAGYQYCQLCGEAVLAPHPCTEFHDWDDGERVVVKNGSGADIGLRILQKCTQCGERKEFTMGGTD